MPEDLPTPKKSLKQLEKEKGLKKLKWKKFYWYYDIYIHNHTINIFINGIVF